MDVCKIMRFRRHGDLEKAQEAGEEVATFCCNDDMVVPLSTMEGLLAVEDISTEPPVHDGLVVDSYVLKFYNLSLRISSA